MENEFVISELSHSYWCIISKVLKSEPTERASEKEGRKEGMNEGREEGREGGRKERGEGRKSGL